MQLYLSPTSPFGRICLIRAMQLDLRNLKLTFVNPWDNPPELEAHNPLSQIPVLLTDDGTAITGSLLICQYFDRQSQNAQALSLIGFAAGLLDNFIQTVKLVRFKAENSDDHPLAERSRNAVARALPRVPEFSGDTENWPELMLAAVLLTVKLRNPELFGQNTRNDTKQAVELFEQRGFARKTDPAWLEANRPADIAELL